MKLLVDAARTAGIVHVAEVDDHELTDDEISDTPDYRTTYPAHCLRGTNGARKIPETSQVDPVLIPLEPRPERYLAGREFLLPKKTVDVFTNPNTDRLLEWLDPAEIVVFGVATDVCDDAAIRGFLARGLEGALRGGRRSRPGRGARGDLHSLVAQAGSRIHVRCGGRRELLG